MGKGDGEMAEENAMDFPKRGNFEWNLNTMVILGGVVTSIAATGIAWGVLRATLENNDATFKEEIARINMRFREDDAVRRERVADFQTQLRDVRQQLTQIPALGFKIDQGKEALEESRKRVDNVEAKVDRVTENLSAKLDAVLESLNRVATRVEVLGSKFDDLKKRDEGNNGAKFTTPIIRP